MEGEKNSGTLSFDLTLEQLHTVKGREMERKMGWCKSERELESRGGTDGEIGVGAKGEKESVQAWESVIYITITPDNSLEFFVQINE